MAKNKKWQKLGLFYVGIGALGTLIAAMSSISFEGIPVLLAIFGYPIFGLIGMIGSLFADIAPFYYAMILPTFVFAMTALYIIVKR